MLYVTRGWAAPETVAAVGRVGMLAEKCGNLRQLIGSMIRRSGQSLFAGELGTAGGLADQALELAQRERSSTMLAHVHELQQVIRYYRGDFAGAEKYFAAGFKFFDDPIFRGTPAGGPALVFTHAAYCAFLAGRVNLARDRITSAAAAAISTSSAYHRSFADMGAALVHTWIGENEEAEIEAARALELAEKHKIPSVAANLRCLLGYVRTQLDLANGIELIRRGLTEVLDTGFPLALGVFSTWPAVAQQRAGKVDDALETAERALEFAPEVLLYRPESLRVRGELHLAKGHTERAEADFRDSIKLAKSMGAKTWELRTAMSLARLLESQSRRDEARGKLAEIYNWFTEGFDTADLKEAKALLEELAK